MDGEGSGSFSLERGSSRILVLVSLVRSSTSEGDDTNGEVDAMALRLDEATREATFAVDGTDTGDFESGSWGGGGLVSAVMASTSKGEATDGEVKAMALRFVSAIFAMWDCEAALVSSSRSSLRVVSS